MWYASIYPVSASLLSIQLPVSMTTGNKASIVPAGIAHFGHLELYLFAEVKPLLLKKGGLKTWWVLPSSIPRLRQSFVKLFHRSACCRSQWKVHHSNVMYVGDSWLLLRIHKRACHMNNICAWSIKPLSMPSIMLTEIWYLKNPVTIVLSVKCHHRQSQRNTGRVGGGLRKKKGGKESQSWG